MDFHNVEIVDLALAKGEIKNSWNAEMANATRKSTIFSAMLVCFACSCSAISIYYIVYLMTSIFIVISRNTKLIWWFMLKNINSIENHYLGTSSALHRSEISKVQQLRIKSMPCWWSFDLNSSANVHVLMGFSGEEYLWCLISYTRRSKKCSIVRSI